MKTEQPRSPLYALLLVLAVLQSLLASGAAAGAVEPEDEVWVLVDTDSLTLAIMRGNTELRRYDNIAIGSNGPSVAKLVSDETTPLGDFHISGINPRSRYHLFMALDYPTMEHAQRALDDGRIDIEEYVAVSNAWLAGSPPPQNTRLGGYLGIHGLGEGSTKIHGSVNWTDGCIAVTNEQMDELAALVGVGTKVSVR
ncbi:MAG: L,D-transpeptidase [Pseudomonadales bacterium]|nr:L,D-transpeptidase [Halieaceae bacterium]MCP5189039.1 L,D-transpeptidase [Pseudomonadales bacterium]